MSTVDDRGSDGEHEKRIGEADTNWPARYAHPQSGVRG